MYTDSVDEPFCLRYFFKQRASDFFSLLFLMDYIALKEN